MKYPDSEKFIHYQLYQRRKDETAQYSKIDRIPGEVAMAMEIVDLDKDCIATSTRLDFMALFGTFIFISFGIQNTGNAKLACF